MKYLVYCLPASELRKWELTVTNLCISFLLDQDPSA